MPALLIKNGRVIDPAAGHDAVADVWIEDGAIKGVGHGLSAAGAEVFDATGLIVAPGFIDMHVHLREPGFEHAETIESGARACDRERISYWRHHSRQQGRGTRGHRFHAAGRRGRDLRRRTPRDERAAYAARYGIRTQLPDAGDQPLRGPAFERGRRYARRCGIGTLGFAPRQDEEKKENRSQI